MGGVVFENALQMNRKKRASKTEAGRKVLRTYLTEDALRWYNSYVFI